MKEKYMFLAIKESHKCATTEDFPVGCVIIEDDKVISLAHNSRNKSNVTIDHAEITAIIEANMKKKSWRLDDCDMYVTLEPCEMCKNVIREARINKIYFLVSRNLEKKPYSKCKFEKVVIGNRKSDKYINDIKVFFTDKR